MSRLSEEELRDEEASHKGPRRSCSCPSYLPLLSAYREVVEECRARGAAQELLVDDINKYYGRMKQLESENRRLREGLESIRGTVVNIRDAVWGLGDELHTLSLDKEEDARPRT